MICTRCGAATDLGLGPRDERGQLVCASCPAPVVRQLELATDLHVTLARVAELRASGQRCAFAAPKLDAIEDRLGSVVPDAVLALLLARGLSLDRLTELTNERVVYGETTHGRAAPVERQALIVLDAFGDWPRFSVGYYATDARTEPTLVMWDWKSWTADKKPPWPSVRAYVLARLGGKWADDAPLDLETAPSAEALRRFSPVIEATAAPLVEAPRFVRHTKFGRGRVLRETGDQLEVDFGDGGVRKLLARFVTPEPRDG